MKGKGFLVFLLIVSVIVNVFLLMFERKPEEKIIEKIPAADMNQIREIAVACGTNPAQASNASPKELLSDIKSVLMDAEPFYGTVLQEKDLQIVRSYLNDQGQLLKAIERQNKFLLGLKGKRILVLPQDYK